MSEKIYSVVINRPLKEVLGYLAILKVDALPGDGGLSFETVPGGGTRIVYQTSQEGAGFFKLADVLLAQIALGDHGHNVPELVFEAC